MDTILSLYNSVPGRFVLLSLAIGIMTSGAKLPIGPDSFLRTILPAIPVLIGCALAVFAPGIWYVPSVDASLPLGMGAGALSSSAVELYNRYKEDAFKKALAMMARNSTPLPVTTQAPTPTEPNGPA